ncbi:MAG: phosphoglucomutase/phosphomannomutase family protein, partial [Bacteroidetes bacterium]|nr:phosphoglucomutase/phosphomannomutase family protein [Bacteroidota bacterium]
MLKKDGLDAVGGRSVVATETLDGFKFRVDGGWLMFRPSGTEPVLRIYSEAGSQEEADALVQDGIALVENE